MAGCGWIHTHTRFHSFDLELWHRFQKRNLISTKTEKQEKTTQSKHIISQKDILHEDPPGKNTKNAKTINQNLVSAQFCLFCGLCVVFLFCFWFFFFAFWVSSFLFFCLQCFCMFLDLTIFQKCCVFQNHFSLQRASKQIPGSIQSWDRKKNRSKMYERKGGQPHPSLEYISGFNVIRL